MKLRRITPGFYESTDHRVQIRKEQHKNYGSKETHWTITIDNKELWEAADTKRDAIYLVEKILQEETHKKFLGHLKKQLEQEEYPDLPGEKIITQEEAKP